MVPLFILLLLLFSFLFHLLLLKWDSNEFPWGGSLSVLNRNLFLRVYKTWIQMNSPVVGVLFLGHRDLPWFDPLSILGTLSFGPIVHWKRFFLKKKREGTENTPCWEENQNKLKRYVRDTLACGPTKKYIYKCLL